MLAPPPMVQPAGRIGSRPEAEFEGMLMSEETIAPSPRVTSSQSSDAPSGEASELALLRKEVIEARNLVIKTDNLLKNLHAELKKMGNRQDEQEKRHWMTSVTAYIVFALIAASGAFLYAQSAIKNEREAATQNEARAQQLTKDAEALHKADAIRKDASEKAARIFEMLGSEKEGPGLNQAMSQAMHLDRAQLSQLESHAIDDRAAGMKQQIAQGALDRGQRAFRQQDWRTCSTELARYIELQPKVDDPMVWFHLGNARSQLKEWAGVIQPLENYLKAVPGTKTSQYVGLLLGTALEETGNFTKSRDAYERAVSLYPGSDLAPMIRGRLRHLPAAQAAAAASGPQPSAAPVKP